MPARWTNYLLVPVLAAGCAFDPQPSGVEFAPAEDAAVERRAPADAGAPDTGAGLGDACIEFFHCVLEIPTAGGSMEGCIGKAPDALAPVLEELDSCRIQECNDLEHQPGSESFAPSEFKNCMKYSCPLPLLTCLAHGSNATGCKSYVVCESNCQSGVLCDFECMSGLAAGDVDSTAAYLECKRTLLENPDPAQLCECGAMCNVTFPTCE